MAGCAAFPFSLPMIPRFWRKRRETPSPPYGPVVIYHHIAKTGGTSLREVVQANYKGKALLELYGPNRGSVAWYEAYYRSLSPERKAAIQCIAAHSAHYIIPVLDRPFRVFTLLRDPVNRVISLYYFAKTLTRKGKGKGADIGRLLDALGWDLGDIYRHAAQGEIDPEHASLLAPFFNGQTRAILGPHLDVTGIPFLPGAPASLHNALQHALHILDAHYELGVTEAYAQSVQYFARVFGWRRVFIDHVNRTKMRPSVQEFPLDVIDRIREYNQLDVILHAHAQNYLKQHLEKGLKSEGG